MERKGKVEMKMGDKFKKILIFILILSLIMPSVDTVFPTEIKVSAKTMQKKRVIFRNVPEGKLTLYVGQTYVLGTEVQPSGSAKKVKYSCSKKNIITVTGTGKVKALKMGTVQLTAKMSGNASKKLKIKITVVKKKKYKKIKKITVIPQTIYMNQGESSPVKLQFSPAKASNKNVKYSSANEKIAVVDEKGVITAVSEGNTKIRVKALDGSGKSAAAKVVVASSSDGKVTVPSDDKMGDGAETDVVYVSSIQLSQSEASVHEGSTVQITAAVQPENASIKTLQWSSLNPEIADVSGDGLIQGLQAGETTVIVTAVGNPQIFIRIPVKVRKKIKVTFDTQGGSALNPITVYEGDSLTAPVPVKSGYHFLGWYRDKTGETAFDGQQSLPGEDITLFACWEEEYLTLETDGNRSLQAEEAHLRLTGTYHTNGNIKDISYILSDESGEKESGQAILGSSLWELTNLSLSPGENTIVLKACTYGGAETETTVFVTYDRGGLDTAPDWNDIGGVEMDDNGEIACVSAKEQADMPYVRNRMLLYWQKNVSETRKQEILEEIGAAEIGSLKTIGLCQAELALEYATMQDILDYAEKLSVLYEEIYYAEPEWIFVDGEQGAVVKSDEDTLLGSLYQSVNWWKDAVYAVDTDKYGESLHPVRVGIVDSGFDTEHKDLEIHFSREQRKNENTASAHGTHVAGVIGADSDDSTGIRGIASVNDLYGYDWRVDETQQWGTSAAILDLYVDAIESGCKVVNISSGFSGNLLTDSQSVAGDCLTSWSRGTSLVLGRLLEQGFDFTVVQSAGNGAANGFGVDAVNNGFFASVQEEDCYSSEQISKEEIMNRIIVVGAVEQISYGYYGYYKYQQTSFSNGGNRVDIVAPGRNIYSTISGGYGYLEGTSLAAAIAAGEASLIWSVHEDFTGAQVKEILVKNAHGTIADNTSSAYTTGTYAMICVSCGLEAAISSGGTVSGYFSDAENGEGIQASYIIHKDTKEGEIIGNTDGYTSDTEGNFTIDSLSAGNYVLEIKKDGYITDYMDISVPLTGNTSIGNLSLSKILASEEYRIVMTWGDGPEDLDGHFRGVSTTGNDVHIYYKNPLAEGCRLDIDDSSYYGPETITISDLSAFAGIRYAVHNFTDKDCEKFGTNADTLAKSNAVVKVYRADVLLQTYRVPANIKGTEWIVFALDAEGNLQDINAMDFESNAASVLQD